jgi:Protein of unknown function (DUF2587)
MNGTIEPITALQPGKIMRVGVMTQYLLDESRRASLDEAGRWCLRNAYAAVVSELGRVLPDELSEELFRLTQPFQHDETPTQGELRLAQAQLAGWLQGVVQGMQATLFAQQIAAQSPAQVHNAEMSKHDQRIVGSAYL